MDLARLDHIPTVKLAMTPFPHSVDADAPLSAALAMMDAHGVHQLPVTDQGRLVGVVAKGDVELTRKPVPTMRPDLLGLFDKSELSKYMTEDELA